MQPSDNLSSCRKGWRTKLDWVQNGTALPDLQKARVIIPRIRLAEIELQISVPGDPGVEGDIAIASGIVPW